MSSERRRRYCPVCWRSVLPATGRWLASSAVSDIIEGHWDNTFGSICPGSYEPCRITQFGRNPAA